MKKIILSWSVLIGIIMLLTGCGIGKVNEKNIAKDLVGKNISVKNDDMSSKFDFTKLKATEIKNFSVTKEAFDKDKRQDIIYGQVKLSYNRGDDIGEIIKHDANGEIKLTYNYYDKGGWILDNVEASSLDDWKSSSSKTQKYMLLPKLSITKEDILRVFGSAAYGVQAQGISNISLSTNISTRRVYVDFDDVRNVNDLKLNEHCKFTYHYNDLYKNWSFESKEINNKEKTGGASITKEQAKELVSKKEGSQFGFTQDGEQGDVEEFQNMNCYAFTMNEKDKAQITTFYVEINTGKLYYETGEEVN